MKDFRKELSKAYDLGVNDEDEDVPEDVGRSTNEKDEERKKQEQQNLLYLLERDPNARKAAIEAGNQASINAIK